MTTFQDCAIYPSLKDKGYSQYSYDLKAATNQGVIYPSIDPMVFELKYPRTDIVGRVIPL